MKRYQSRTAKRYIIILCMLLVVFLLNISTIPAAEPQQNSLTSSDVSYQVSTSARNSFVKEYDDLYSSILNNPELSNNAVTINGATNNLIELPENSKAVQLSDNRIAIKYSDDISSILPEGSTIVENEDGTILAIPNQDAMLKVSEIVILPIKEFTTSATYKQSIDNLDEYKVKISFSELDKEVMRENLVGYSVDWGDCNNQHYTIDDKTVTHTYKKSGTYDITVDISDDFGLTHSLNQDYTVDYEGHLTHSYLWVKENKEPVAVSTTSMSAVAVGLFALTETGKYKLLALLPLLIPMYTRIQKEDVLDQFVRGQIYGYIRTNPGVHYNQIRRGIQVKNGTLSYHLSVLEKTELIKSRREGLRYRVFYPTGMKFPQKQRFRLTEFQISIIDIIKQNEGITQKEIVDKLEKKPQTINYNIKVLEQADLIDVIKKGRKTVCFYKEPPELSNNPAE